MVAGPLEAGRFVQRQEVAATDVVLLEELDALLAGGGRVDQDGVEGAAAGGGHRHVIFDVDGPKITQAAYGNQLVKIYLGPNQTNCSQKW